MTSQVEYCLYDTFVRLVLAHLARLWGSAIQIDTLTFFLSPLSSTRLYFCRALDVLDLLLTFQFNTRLESFIAKFKTAEVSVSTKKHRSILVPLLYNDFDPFDTSK